MTGGLILDIARDGIVTFLKVAQNQSDYQLAASLYQKSLQMLRTAVGRR